MPTVVGSESVGRKVDLDELIDVNGVAAILGLSHRNTVTTYLRRYADMPRPVVEFKASRVRLWLRSEIVDWAETTGRSVGG